MKNYILPILMCFFAQQLTAQVASYTYSASVGTFDTLNTSTGTNVSAIQADDATSSAIPLGFTFKYEGVNYTHVKANSNGWITLDTNLNPSSFNQRTNNLSIGPAVRPIIAPLWDDLKGDLGTATYLTSGTAPNRVFTMEWKNYRWNWQASGGVVSFQVKLYEDTNNIEFVYRPESIAVSSGSASVGISNTATGSGNYLSVSDLTSTATTSTTTETSNINTKPVSGLTFKFTKIVCTANFSSFPSSSVCDNAGTLFLSQGSGTPSGGTGTYIGAGISGNMFNPAIAGVGTHTIKYAYSITGCTDTASQTLRVDSVTPMLFNMQSFYCENADSVQLTALPIGGTFSGPGVQNGYFHPDRSGGAGIKTVQYSFTNLLMCSDSTTVQVQVDTAPNVALNLPNQICLNTTGLNLTGGTPTGGNYFGTNVSGTTYQPVQPGTDTVYYGFSGSNGCADTVFKSITVDTVPTVNFANIGRVCEGSSPLTLNQATPAGGVYAGNNVLNGIYTPSTPRTDTITYKLVDANGCSDSASQTITVDSVTSVTLSSISNRCSNAPAIALNHGQPSGGVYKGRGVVGSLYNPAIAGAGFDTLTYVFVNAFNCADSMSRVVTIHQKPTVTFNTPIYACALDSAFVLTGAIPIGGTYSGTAVNSSTAKFSPGDAGLGSYPVKYKYTDGNSCSDSVQQMVHIEANPNFSLGNDIEICGTSEATLDPGISNAVYLWSTGEKTQTIKVQKSSVFAVTVTDTSTVANCKYSDEIRVEYDAVCVGISEQLEDKVNVVYYPNPSSGRVNVQMSGFETGEISISVSDMSGKRVYEKESFIRGTEQHETLDLENLSNGIYNVSINTKKGVVLHRISIQR